jgi:sulfite reductase beta subunit-like hemoprotein
MRPTDAQHQEALAGHADRLRRHLEGRLPDTSWAPIRLGYGLYYQLDHTSHMQRIKVPGGLLTAEQLEALAEVSERWGRGIAHVTTRQDLQIHWVPAADVIEMYQLLLAAGITTRGACADSVRNVTGCPYAGVSPHEPFDVAPYALALHEYFLFNPLNLTLPRKFKIAVEGCPEDCAQVPINDIGYYAKERDGQRGFSVWAGGGLGAQPYLAVPISEFIPAEDVLIWSEAIVRVQHRHAERKNRKRSRMKYVVKRLGAERFRQLIEEQVAEVDRERGDELRREIREMVAAYRLPEPVAAPKAPAAARAGFDRWRLTNVRPQRQAGRWTVDIRVPLGDVTSDELRQIARLARTYGNGTVRATNDQNLVMPSVATNALPALHAELDDLGLGDPDVHTITDVVSCPGMDYCSLAITRSMGVAERIRTAFMRDPATGNGFAAELGPFSIKISGCPNSCGQHHVGNIGLTGHNVTGEDGADHPHYSILAGGSVGEHGGRVGMRVGRFPEEQTPGAIAALAKLYAAEREAGESFAAFAERIGRDRLTTVAEAGARGS